MEQFVKVCRITHHYGGGTTKEMFHINLRFVKFVYEDYYKGETSYKLEYVGRDNETVLWVITKQSYDRLINIFEPDNNGEHS